MRGDAGDVERPAAGVGTRRRPGGQPDTPADPHQHADGDAEPHVAAPPVQAGRIAVGNGLGQHVAGDESKDDAQGQQPMENDESGGNVS